MTRASACGQKGLNLSLSVDAPTGGAGEGSMQEEM